MTADESLDRAEELLAKLEAARARLEATGDEDLEPAIEVLQELLDITKQIDAEIENARKAAEADAADA
jgi:exonuclease VII small subunit